MTPRPFQARALSAIGDKCRDGARAVLLVSPTGSGKTCMGAMAVAALVAEGKRVAWGAHRAELLEQAAETLHSFGMEVGHRGLGRSAAVQLGTYQTWSARDSAPDADWLIADEAHHLGDKVGWQRIPETYKAAGKRLLGLTATPARGDGRALPDFDAIVVAAQIAELQELGLLVPLRWRGPGSYLSRGTIAEAPVAAYLRETPGECAVVFAPHKRAAIDYAAGFRDAGIPGAIVTGNMDRSERAAVLAEHRDGKLSVLINVHVLTEGWDNPRCSCVIMARSCESPVLWIQAAGRALRPYPGKVRATLLDLRGTAHVLGRPDAQATYSLDGAGIVLAADSCPAGERLCKVCRVPLGKELVCTDCGHDHTPKVPRAVGAPLTDWDVRWDAAKSGLRPSRIVTALAGIMHKAQLSAEKGKPWKPGAAAVRFSFIFKRRPYPQEMAAAANFLKAADSYQVGDSA